MIIVVLSSRDWTDVKVVQDAVADAAEQLPVGEVMLFTDNERGAANYARNYARHQGYQVVQFETGWGTYGSHAPWERDQKMIEVAWATDESVDLGNAVVLAFRWDDSADVTRALKLARRQFGATRVEVFEDGPDREG